MTSSRDLTPNPISMLDDGPTSQNKNNELIINTLLQAKNIGKAQSTLKCFANTLKIISRNTKLTDTEKVKTFIANLKATNATKQKYVVHYALFCKINNIPFIKPNYKQERKPPMIPSTENIDKIISACTTKYATIFTILKETGLEAYELATMQRNQIDTQRGIINAIGCKGHNSRSFKLKENTAQLLREYLARYTKNQPFPSSKIMGEIWRRERNNLAKKLNNPELKNIPMRNLRHHFATTMYDKTKDILLIKQLLGHKKLETTMYYTTLNSFSEEDEYTAKTASNLKEATDLIEHGFQYVTEIDGIKIFKKRK